MTDTEQRIGPAEQDLPLSERPEGYLIAVAAGVLGGPLGMLASPAVLGLLNSTMKANGKHPPRRFAVWALAGVVGVPLSLLMLRIPLIATDTNGLQAEKVTDAELAAEQGAVAAEAKEGWIHDAFPPILESYMDSLGSSFQPFKN